MLNFVVDIEFSLTDTEFAKFKKLSDELDKSIGDLVRLCANEKCDEYLEMFEKNVPDEEEEEVKVTSIEDIDIEYTNEETELEEANLSENEGDTKGD